MTDQELKDFIADLARSIDKLQKDVAEEQRETARQIKEVNKQLGALGNKFGSFTEGLALPSMEKVFYREFGLDVVQPRARSRQNGRTMEVDVLAYDHPGGSKDVFVIEVKSHLTEEGIEQIRKTIEEFPKFFPWGRDRTIYGVIAAVDIPDNVRDKVLKEGLYLARISDGTFTMQVPRGFKPKAFYPNGKLEGNGRKKNGAKPARKRGKKARKGSQ
ncbi:MAG: DUF3782 domain-containing protein [Blastocatellia bacterium]